VPTAVMAPTAANGPAPPMLPNMFDAVDDNPANPALALPATPSASLMLPVRLLMSDAALDVVVSKMTLMVSTNEAIGQLPRLNVALSDRTHSRRIAATASRSICGTRGDHTLPCPTMSPWRTVARGPYGVARYRAVRGLIVLPAGRPFTATRHGAPVGTHWICLPSRSTL